MKKTFRFLLIISLFGLSSCQEDEVASLKSQLTDAPWQLTKVSLFDGRTVLDWSDGDSYTFNNNGRYKFEDYLYSFAESITIEGEWSLDESKRIINFITKDTAYYHGFRVPEGIDTVMAKYNAPSDWVVNYINAKELKVNFPRGDSISIDYMILTK